MPSGLMASGPAVANLLFFTGMIAGYWRNRKFRDPLAKCGNECLHLPQCPFYRESPDDPRGFAHAKPDDTAASSAPQSLPDPIRARIFPIIMAIAGIVTVVPAVFFSAYFLRQIRIRRGRCKCLHRPKCYFGASQYQPPSGCDEWTLAEDGYYESPCGHFRKQAIVIRSSSGRSAYRKRHFERQKNGKAA